MREPRQGKQARQSEDKRTNASTKPDEQHVLVLLLPESSSPEPVLPLDSGL